MRLFDLSNVRYYEGFEIRVGVTDLTHFAADGGHTAPPRRGTCRYDIPNALYILRASVRDEPVIDGAGMIRGIRSIPIGKILEHGADMIVLVGREEVQRYHLQPKLDGTFRASTGRYIRYRKTAGERMRIVTPRMAHGWLETYLDILVGARNGEGMVLASRVREAVEDGIAEPDVMHEILRGTARGFWRDYAVTPTNGGRNLR